MVPHVVHTQRHEQFALEGCVVVGVVQQVVEDVAGNHPREDGLGPTLMSEYEPYCNPEKHI